MTPQEQRSTTEVERIRNQFRRAFDGEAWHGPSVLAILNGVTAQQAAAHPIPGAHSIWELTLHIAAWERACLRRLQGDPAQLTDAEDWPPVNDTSEGAWENTKQLLIDNHQRHQRRGVGEHETTSNRQSQPTVDRDCESR
jgi:hypothetical protein